MPKINAGDFKKGLKIELDGDPYEMIECTFQKPGKGQALYKTRLKNLLTGTMLDRTYRSGDGLESADVHRADGQYSYRDSTGYVFMDEFYEQHTMDEEVCGDKMKFVMEGATVGMLFWNSKLIDITPPQHVVMEVTYTEPAAKGNTATNVTKPAKVESGAEVQVPAFINEGEKIKIDVETATYIERVRD